MFSLNKISDFILPFKADKKSDNNMKNSVHFLHIGKCAGTAIKDFAEATNAAFACQVKIISHDHNVSLSDIPTGASYFFSIRDPVTRFYSAFYSRKRKGAPRYYGEWSEGEARAFERFPEANDLAESLFNETSTGFHAFSAMKSIGHLCKFQHDWFPDIEEIFTARPPMCILRTEFLEADFVDLKKLIGLSDGFDLIKDPVKAHKNDYRATLPLTDKAVKKLRIWYASDILFYKLANTWIANFQKNRT